MDLLLVLARTRVFWRFVVFRKDFIIPFLLVDPQEFYITFPEILIDSFNSNQINLTRAETEVSQRANEMKCQPLRSTWLIAIF